MHSPPNTAQIAAIVIGGSAGCLSALRQLLTALPSVGPPVFVTVHLPARTSLSLHEWLAQAIHRPVHLSEDKEVIRSDTVYLAPPDYHLLIERHGALALSVDAPVHHSRPSIDVLFETACDAYAPQLLGILLSGASADGAAGLLQIHLAGGITLVQSPASAESPVMPTAALALFEPTYVLNPDDMTKLLTTSLQHQ